MILPEPSWSRMQAGAPTNSGWPVHSYSLAMLDPQSMSHPSVDCQCQQCSPSGQRKANFTSLLPRPPVNSGELM